MPSCLTISAENHYPLRLLVFPNNVSGIFYCRFERQFHRDSRANILHSAFTTLAFPSVVSSAFALCYNIVSLKIAVLQIGRRRHWCARDMTNITIVDLESSPSSRWILRNVDP